MEIQEAISNIQTHETSLQLQRGCSNTKREWKVESDGVLSLSCYRKDTPATEQKLALWAAHLKNAFPNTATDGMCVELIRLAIKQGMSEEQFQDAVEHFIAHHHFPTFTVADVLDYDVRLRLYTGAEVYKICGCIGSEYDLLVFPKFKKIDGVLYRVKMAEVEQLPGQIQLKVRQQIEKMKMESSEKK